MNLGYACINMSMGKKVTTNRSMVKRTFEARGLDYVSELALLNAKDIIKILEWNRLNGINFFRLSSALVPWGDNLDLTQLKDYKEIKFELKKAGRLFKVGYVDGSVSQIAAGKNTFSFSTNIETPNTELFDVILNVEERI